MGGGAKISNWMEITKTSYRTFKGFFHSNEIKKACLEIIENIKMQQLNSESVQRHILKVNRSSATAQQ